MIADINLLRHKLYMGTCWDEDRNDYESSLILVSFMQPFGFHRDGCPDTVQLDSNALAL